MKKALIIGAGGHTRSLIELLEQSEWQIEGIIDESFNSDKQETVLGYAVVGDWNWKKLSEYQVFIGNGRLQDRDRVFKQFQKQLVQENVWHPRASISKHTKMGFSNQIFANAMINSEVIIGNNNIINTSSVIEHNCVIGNHNHISIGALVCGKVTIGSHCFLGAGSVIKDGISICDDVTVGANSVVIQDITLPGTYVGNPTKRLP